MCVFTLFAYTLALALLTLIHDLIYMSIYMYMSQAARTYMPGM